MSNFGEFLFEQVLAALIAVLVGLIIAAVTQYGYYQIFYGGWKVVLTRRGKTVLTRAVPARKAHDIRSDPSEKSVYLKGIMSPYIQLNCDLIEDGHKLKMLIEDTKTRVFTINLDKNPRKRSTVTK